MRARFDLFPGLLAVSLLAGVTARANINFNLIPDAGTPQYAIDAFNLAASRWSTIIADNVTVNLAVGYESMPSGVLGQTINTTVTPDYASALAALNASSFSAADASAYAHLQIGPTYTRLVNHTADNPSGTNSATPYTESLATVYATRANAKALGLLGASAEIDGTIRFNSNTPFDFDPADGTTSGQYDFATVAAHEMGHILGFVSAVDHIEQSGGTIPGSQLPAAILDLFRFSSSSLAVGPAVIDTTANPNLKYFSVNGGVTSVAGFASGAVYGTGYQASHWREFTYKGLMDPHVFMGLQRNLTYTDLMAFDVLGYRFVPEPSSLGLVILGAVILAFFLNQRRHGPLR